MATTSACLKKDLSFGASMLMTTTLAHSKKCLSFGANTLMATTLARSKKELHIMARQMEDVTGKQNEEKKREEFLTQSTLKMLSG